MAPPDGFAASVGWLGNAPVNGASPATWLRRVTDPFCGAASPVAVAELPGTPRPVSGAAVIGGSGAPSAGVATVLPGSGCDAARAIAAGERPCEGTGGDVGSAGAGVLAAGDAASWVGGVTGPDAPAIAAGDTGNGDMPGIGSDAVAIAAVALRVAGAVGTPSPPGLKGCPAMGAAGIVGTSPKPGGTVVAGAAGTVEAGVAGMSAFRAGRDVTAVALCRTMAGGSGSAGTGCCAGCGSTKGRFGGAAACWSVSGDCWACAVGSVAPDAGEMPGAGEVPDEASAGVPTGAAGPPTTGAPDVWSGFAGCVDLATGTAFATATGGPLSAGPGYAGVTAGGTDVDSAAAPPADGTGVSTKAAERAALTGSAAAAPAALPPTVTDWSRVGRVAGLIDGSDAGPPPGLAGEDGCDTVFWPPCAASTCANIPAGGRAPAGTGVAVAAVCDVAMAADNVKARVSRSAQ